MPWRDDVTLHRQIVLHQLAEHSLGEPPEILVGRDAWLPRDAKQRLDEVVRDDLAEVGLLSRGRLREDFYDALALLARPALEIFGWVQSGEYGHYAVAVARSGRNAVVVLRRDEWVRLMPANPETAVEHWIEQIPAFGAGAGLTISLPEADAPWTANARPTPESRRLEAVLNLPRYGGGQVHAAVRQGGSRRSARPALTYLDTEQGRWLIGFDREQSRDRWVTFTPATQQAFVRKITDLIDLTDTVR
ncbi:ESX secretion-associated protein EspG [Amycolatopsis nigrescens]|uniref:ESX secretion-associated protein EspG n=1 Tax=Amycolatopsis nigrescens TaxID=381445 RepID=UPI00037FEB44|nr:ESX secretion-associated protein EspG [Amycolatopsis nigrescens]